MIKKWLSVSLLLSMVCLHAPAEEAESLLPPNKGVKNFKFLSQLEKDVIIELNRARTHPGHYASHLEAFKKHYKGKYIRLPGRTPLVTVEGAAAVDEAIEFLRLIRPVPALRVSRGLSRAAEDHVRDQGPKGLTGHYGTDNSTAGKRMTRHGRCAGAYGENINYGSPNAREIVMQLIINDGIPHRGHRINIFRPEYQLVGVSCGPHARFKQMCVIDFAESYQEKSD